jgi:hypothetical protein
LGEVLWSFLERYRELIINGLDLLSFALITPVLLRFIKPAVSTLFPATLLLTLMLPYLYFLYITQDRWNATDSTMAQVILWGVIPTVVGGIVAMLLILSEERLLRAGGWIAGHLFVFGLFSFFVARLFAVVLAIHQIYE